MLDLAYGLTPAFTPEELEAASAQAEAAWNEEFDFLSTLSNEELDLVVETFSFDLDQPPY